MQVGSIQNSSASLASSTTKVSGFAYYDPRDTNKDGIVSPAELSAYALTHPEPKVPAQLATTAHKAALNQYTQRGSLNAWGPATPGFFDMYG
jgi:hypothetical protein